MRLVGVGLCPRGQQDRFCLRIVIAEPLLPWLAQAAILGILLLVPALSRILAVGTLALLLALLPLAGFFVAFGGAGQSEGAATLVVLLSSAWLAGVGAAILTAWRVRAPGRSP